MADLNLRDLRQKHYTRLSGERFNLALAQLQISNGWFAWVTGSNRQRVRDWLKGREDIPPWVTLVVCLLNLPGGISMAREVTRQFSLAPEPGGEEAEPERVE